MEELTLKGSSFYIPSSFRYIWDKFVDIAKREGKNASLLLRELVSGYVNIHDPGNPQARLTSYSEGEEADMAAIEGRVREFFRKRFMDGRLIYWRDIVRLCKTENYDISSSLSMAGRVSDWLKSMEVEVWR